MAHVETFAFAIGEGTLRGDLASRYARYDLVVLDGEEAPRRKVASLRSAGKVVLGYLSVGTIERWRSWYPARSRTASEPGVTGRASGSPTCRRPASAT